jgi:hypothetical protein
MNCPPCNHNCHQGTNCPAHYDTLRDRMQEPPARSPWARIAALIVFVAVVTVAYLLNLKGIK